VPDLIVAGAGMAGLCAAAEARARGADVAVLEKGDRVGGAMLLSSGVVWRHREFADFRAECPAGQPELQRLVYDRLDGDLAWLETLGAVATERDTGNPRTTGVRFDTRALTACLARAAGDVRLGEPLRDLPAGVPTILATGGFAASRALVREHVTPEADALLLRATPWSEGDGLRLATAAGASPSAGMDEFYGRAMPAPPARIAPADFVRLAQLYARHATVTNVHGERWAVTTWSEIDVVQWIARQPGARAFYRVEPDALAARVRERTVADMVAAAERAGAPVHRDGDAVVVEVRAAITTTLGGVRVDARGRAAPGVWAAGADAGGVATGGYASGLAAALVLGRVAAADALAGGAAAA
jgi:succinate dehydrogenase/fumarate reductase flavoprotein subunit